MVLTAAVGVCMLKFTLLYVRTRSRIYREFFKFKFQTSSSSSEMTAVVECRVFVHVVIFSSTTAVRPRGGECRFFIRVRTA